jgi:hypothetical protein
LREVGLYPCAQQFDLVWSQQLPQTDRSIALKGADIGVRHFGVSCGA